VVGAQVLDPGRRPCGERRASNEYVRTAGDAPLVGAVISWSSGYTLLISAIDGAVYTWDTRVESWIAHACATAGRNFTRDEWRDAFPDRPYRRTCPEHPAGR